MDTKTLDAYKKKMLKKREEIVRAIQALKGQENKNLIEAVDLEDRALMSYEKEFLYQLTQSEQEVYKLIEEALHRMEKGTYGICQACGNEIKSKRLNAVPWARHCIECQGLQERGLLE